MKVIKIIGQIALIHVFLFFGAAVKEIFPISLPASMIGLLFLLLALLLGIVKLQWIEQGGNWLLAELLLFFIPSAVGIVNYEEMFSWQGIQSVLLIGVSTFIVIITTAFIAEKITNQKEREMPK